MQQLNGKSKSSYKIYKIMTLMQQLNGKCKVTLVNEHKPHHPRKYNT